MSEKEAILSAEHVRRVLAYDSNTGAFTWLLTGNRALHAGDRAGSLHPRGYVWIKVGRFSYAAHRLAWLYVHGQWPQAELDHKNGVRSDNQIENLRPSVGPVENNQNTRTYKSNRSGIHGVGWHKLHNKWRARISVAGKQHNLGFFDTKDDAAEAYRLAKERLHRFQPTQRHA